jgi:RND family efflux transporter MFP subunit
LATSNRKRYELAFKNKAVTEQDVQTYRSQEAQAAAVLEASKATLETARLNLEWTKVTAPISGRLSQTLVSRGNLVTADQTQLTTMVSLDPLYVYFDVDEATVEQIQQLIRQGKLKSALPEEIQSPPPPSTKTAAQPGPDNATPAQEGPLAIAVKMLKQRAGQMRQVYLGLANETGNPHVAYVDFFNNQISLSTATLQVRAVFWNHKPAVGPRLFEPGMFIRVRVPTSPAFKALLVSQEAIGTDQNLKYVDVLDETNAVVRKVVLLGGLQDGLQVVASGLEVGQRVVINGMQHVSPGAKVEPKLVPMAVPSPQAPPSASSNSRNVPAPAAPTKKP